MCGDRLEEVRGRFHLHIFPMADLGEVETVQRTVSISGCPLPVMVPPPPPLLPEPVFQDLSGSQLQVCGILILSILTV